MLVILCTDKKKPIIEQRRSSLIRVLFFLIHSLFLVILFSGCLGVVNSSDTKKEDVVDPKILERAEEKQRYIIHLLAQAQTVLMKVTLINISLTRESVKSGSSLVRVVMFKSQMGPTALFPSHFLNCHMVIV